MDLQPEKGTGKHARLQVLLVAYEFPPIQSGQSLRWHYLANELANLRVDVHVVAPRFANVHGFGAATDPRVTVHRTFAGPYIGLAAALAARRTGASTATGGDDTTPSGLLHLYRAGRRALDRVLFPDLRTEWMPFAWTAISRLLRERRFDVLVTSHEPGVTLLLGLAARRRWGLPWLADIGDLVVDLRTPRWRAPLDLRLERAVCRRADHIAVTCEAAVDLLLERHAATCDALESRLSVLSQGFPIAESAASRIPAVESRFVLLVTGTDYPQFRRTEALGSALESFVDGDVTLRIAGHDNGSAAALQRLGARVEMLGMIDHRRCLELQREATVLLSIGDIREHLVPGRVYEYLGAGRPILHVAGSANDPAAALVQRLRRGTVVDNEPAAIGAALGKMLADWRAHRLDEQFDLSPSNVSEHSWPALAQRLLQTIERVRLPQ